MELNFVEVNTYIDSPPLCPEIKLRFLREDAPLKETAPIWRGKPHLFDWEGPRPYWAFAWGGGQALARFILDHPKYVRGKKIVDFGAGSGIAAIAAALSGAALVTATDVDPIAIQAIQLNAALNHVVIKTKCEDIAKKRRQDWNVLLAGDVFSTGGDPYWFLPWVKKGRWILIGEPPERGFPKEYLKKLENYSVRTFPDFEHPEIKEASVYTLLKGMEWREGKEEQIKLGTGFADGIAKGQIILDNTEVASTPLVPEIRVRLLRPDSPLWQSFGDGPDSVRSPRPYWAFAWSGGQGLARYVLDYPEVVKAKRILDFGAGCGIASIAAAKAGAARVVASDIDPISIAVIGYNARLNNVEVETLCADLIYAKNRGWDVILAGDIWYDSRVSRHGLYWLRKLAGEGVMVLTADPGRKYSPSQGLEALADYPCRSLPDLEHPNLQRVFVSRVVAQSSHF